MHMIGARRLVAIAVLALAGCAPSGPVPIRYGQAECSYCRMTVSDNRFGSEFVSVHGKTLTFDSIECLAGYVASAEQIENAGTAYVTDFTHPGTLIPAKDAVYLRATSLRSPMGRDLVAVAKSAHVDDVARSLGAGNPLTWRDVIAVVQHERVHA